MNAKKFPSVENIHVLEIPLKGFGSLSTANVFVLGKGPVTLIDTGPKFRGSFELLGSKLNHAGFDFSDVERIILTHGHIDHFGMASQITRAAGHRVPCYLHPDDIWRTSPDFIGDGLWSDEVAEFSRMAGMPDSAVARMRQGSATFKNFCDPLENPVPMKEGDTFSGPGFDLEVIHTPGHSPGSCCLLEKERKVLFTGDHLIKHVTPNPIIELRKSSISDPEYQSLRAHRESLDKVMSLDVRHAFSGHGEYIDNLKSLICRYKEHHERRMRQIHGALAGRNRHIYDLVEEIFPNICDSKIFLAVSEVFSHLEILMNEGKAEIAHHGLPALFRAV